MFDYACSQVPYELAIFEVGDHCIDDRHGQCFYLHIYHDIYICIHSYISCVWKRVAIRRFLSHTLVLVFVLHWGMLPMIRPVLSDLYLPNRF